MESERSFELNGQTYQIHTQRLPMCVFWAVAKDDVCGMAVVDGKCSGGHPWVPSLHPGNWADTDLS
jgi:hypothetical protein